MVRYRYSPRGVLELQCDCGNWYQLPSPKRMCLSCAEDPFDAILAAKMDAYEAEEKRIARKVPQSDEGHRASQRKYHATHKEQESARWSRWYARHREEYLAKHRARAKC